MNPPSPAARPARLIATMCFAEVMAMLAFACFVTLLPVIAPAFGLSNAQAGLIGGVLLGGYLVAVPLLGPLADRIDARHVYALGAALGALGSIGFATLAQGFWSALACQALIGVGLAGTYIPGMKALSDRVEGRTQSRAAAIYGATFGIGASASMAMAGTVAGVWGWRAAFALATAGPLAAAVVVRLALAPARPRAHGDRPARGGFGPVFANRRVRPYLFSTTTHTWELHAARAWLVAFLVHAEGVHGPDDPLPVTAAVAAAVINLSGPVASVIGNELAHRHGRPAMLAAGTALSGLTSLAVGFLAGSPWIALLAFLTLHMAFMLTDAGVITAGVVAAADLDQRGATLAAQTFMAFGAGFVAPAAFGLVLDLAGGRESTVAWGLAFASLGAIGLLGLIPARLLARQQRHSA